MSPTQKLIARLMRDGMRPKEIAAHLGMKLKTVGRYRDRIFDVLGVNDQLSLVVLLALPLDSPWRKRFETDLD